MNLDNLPAEWKKIEISKICDPKQYKTIPISELTEDGFVVYGANGVIGKYSKFTHEKSTLMITCRGATCGNLHISQPYSYINGNAMALDNVSGHINLRYLYFCLKARGLEDVISGSAQPQITRQNLVNAEIIITSLEEQQEIVRQLYVMLAQVEQIKARLDAIPAILKKFRQSVLADAVSGKLTEDQANNQEWIEKPLSEVASHVVDCPHSTPKWSESGKICVRTTGFKPFFLDLSEQGFVSEEVFNQRNQRLVPQENDILYSREGTVGIACQIPIGVELCLGQRMVLIRAGKSIDDKFLTIVLNSNKILEIVRSKTMGSTAPRVNMSDIRAYPIPLPSLDEQRVIVSKVETFFNSAKNIESLINSAQKRVNLLTQSILAKAFSGELTAEWREQHQELITGINSAESLLAKIQAEREASKPVKKAKKVK